MPRGRKKVKIEQQIPIEQKIQFYDNPDSNSGHSDNNSQDYLQDPSSQDEELKEESGRRQNTLSLLTKRFVKLIKSKDNFILDINQATLQLGVQKRRIYDITNVLQGIGYIQKLHKNKMKWIGGTMDIEVTKEIEELDQQIKEIQEKNRKIDEEIDETYQKLKYETENKKYLNYFVQDDLYQIMNNIQEKPAEMVVVMAPQGTEMEIKQQRLIIQKPKNSAIGLSHCRIQREADQYHYDYRKF